MTPSMRDEGLELRLEGLELRLGEVEQRLEQLTGRLEQAVARIGLLVQDLAEAEAPAVAPPALEAEPAVAPTAAAEPPAARAELAVTPELAQVIRLVHAGRGEEAQRELRRIPEELLAQQPAVVTLVAAALFVQRGDLATGLATLERARALTDDPRLLRVMQLLQEQLA